MSEVTANPPAAPAKAPARKKASSAVKIVKRIKDLAEKTRDANSIDPRIIRVEKKHNARDYRDPANRAHLDELKANIRENGVLNPLLVRFDAGTREVILVDGECRLSAVLELMKEGVEFEYGIPTIQVKGDNEADRTLTMISANMGKNLSQYELGGAFRKLEKFGWGVDKIALKTGYSEQFVNDSLALDDAPEELKKALSLQAVTPSLALASLKQYGASGATKAVKKAIADRTAQGKKGPATKADLKPAKKTVVTKERGTPKAPPVDLEKVFKAAKAVASSCADGYATKDEETGQYYDWVEVDRKVLDRMFKALGMGI